MTLEIDFSHGGNLKSILEAGMNAVTLATEPHYGEYVFLTFRGHSAQAQLHLKCPIGGASAPQLPRAVAIYLKTLFHLTHFTYTHTRLTPRWRGLC